MCWMQRPQEEIWPYSGADTVEIERLKKSINGLESLGTGYLQRRNRLLRKENRAKYELRRQVRGQGSGAESIWDRHG